MTRCVIVQLSYSVQFDGYPYLQCVRNTVKVSGARVLSQVCLWLDRCHRSSGNRYEVFVSKVSA